ncbi:Protein neprosin [Cardamine amara subsp. amara]|uniref:Protein neprosin n=1 Tax=Cardamine amara subsp. amara TaxID=228776 RepID=A0ABD1A5V7_CARAN
MDFALKLAAFVFIVYVVQSRETVRIVKSFKLNANIMYDCVDIYKQPSLNHPLLKNHKIQMEPSFSISKRKFKVKSERRSKKSIQCQNGTVPIIRNTKEYVANAQYWAEKHFHSLTVKSHGTHIAGVISRDQGPYHGLATWMSVHDLNVSRDQISYASIYVGSALNEQLNFIQTGWMVNPSLFGDRRTWSFGIWKGANGAGCLNTICPGFVQVSKTEILSGPFPYPRKEERALSVSIVQDKESGNWWTADIRYKGPDKFIGYWPKELFDVIDISAEMVGVTGGVQASPSGISPPMGNGHLPTEDESDSARVKNLRIVDSNYNVKDGFQIKLEKLIDNEKCYGLIAGKKRFLKVSNLFTYGGPGGKSCGI